MSASQEITAVLTLWANGNHQALNELTPRVHAQLRRLVASYVRNERSDHTLQPTALVHDAFLRLFGQKDIPVWQNRGHFFGIVACLMRQLVIDDARRRQARKRTGHKVPSELAVRIPSGRSADLLSLDDCVEALQQLRPRKCRVVELPYFGGLPTKEIARTLGLSTKTISRDLVSGQGMAVSRNAES